MVTLLPDTAGQYIYLTLKEKNKYMDSYADFLVVFTNMMSNETYSFIGNVFTDNERYTRLDISTAVDDALNGDIKIVATGQFWYSVYGQNSTTNLDPLDAVVVGTLEVGTVHVLTQEEFYDVPSLSIPDSKIYYA